MGINHLCSFLYPLKNKTYKSANNQNKMITVNVKGKVTKLFTFYITYSASIYQIYNETSPEISMSIIMLADVN